MKIVPGTPQIITADTEGIFKLWDIRNFSCVQTFSSDDVDTLNTFVCVTKHRRLVSGGKRVRRIGSVAGRGCEPAMYQHCRGLTTRSPHPGAAAQLHMFDYEKQENPELTDDTTVFAAKYNDTSNTFVTAAGRDVKVRTVHPSRGRRGHRMRLGLTPGWPCLGCAVCPVQVWSAISGALLRRYRVSAQVDLTALCLDGRKRKFITGDHLGNVEVSLGTLCGVHVCDHVCVCDGLLVCVPGRARNDAAVRDVPGVRLPERLQAKDAVQARG